MSSDKGAANDEITADDVPDNFPSVDTGSSQSPQIAIALTVTVIIIIIVLIGFLVWYVVHPSSNSSGTITALP